MRVVPVAGVSVPTRPRLRWLASRSNGARLHAGVDLVAPPHTPVLAPEAGEVVLVSGRDDGDARSPRPGWRGYGPVVLVLRGESGRFHVLAHVTDASPVGTRVHAGAEVALVSRLRHVHWEVRTALQPPRGRAVVEVALNPGPWLDGVDELYSRAQHGCPPRPGNTVQTPRDCRPGAEPGPRRRRPA